MACTGPQVLLQSESIVMKYRHSLEPFIVLLEKETHREVGFSTQLYRFFDILFCPFMIIVSFYDEKFSNGFPSD